MQHITDAMIDELIDFDAAHAVLREAFVQFGQARAAMQERVRTEAGGVKLSTLGAVIPDQGVAGAKVYTTIKGQFSFVILLFSTEDGRPLATFDAAAITRLRTAACTVLAAEALAPARARKLALFGAGVQGRMHAQQLGRRFGLERIDVVDPFASSDVPAALEALCACPVRFTDAASALDGADLVVTASRSSHPLFAGQRLPQGCFVAAIGSSLPHTRELDDVALQRARLIAVEWKPQTLREAGDLVLAAPNCGVEGKLIELADLLLDRPPAQPQGGDLVIYKSVGVGLEDIALAGHAYRQLQV